MLNTDLRIQCTQYDASYTFMHDAFRIRKGNRIMDIQ